MKFSIVFWDTDAFNFFSLLKFLSMFHNYSNTTESLGLLVLQI